MDLVAVSHLKARIAALALATIAVLMPASVATACLLSDPACLVEAEVDDQAVGDATATVEQVADDANDVITATVGQIEDAVDDTIKVVGGEEEPDPDGKDAGTRGTDPTGRSDRRDGRRASAPTVGIVAGVNAVLTDVGDALLVRADDANPAGTIGQVIENVARATFPLALILMVAVFVAVQHRIDARDPKLALSPVGPDDVRFS
jgi:hypothetical protein